MIVVEACVIWQASCAMAQVAMYALQATWPTSLRCAHGYLHTIKPSFSQNVMIGR